MNRQIPWLRVFVEGVVIVGSILLAFGLQAWWEGTQERVQELNLLVRLDAELDAAAAHLREYREYQWEVVAVSEVLLANTGVAASPGISPDSIGSLIWNLTLKWTADPPAGVLRSLISTGQTSLIESEDLREELVNWEALLSDLQAGELAADQVIDGRVIPFLETQIAWRSLIPATEGGGKMTPTSFPLGTEALMRNREFENIVANRRTWVRHIVSEYDAVLADLERVRSLVGQELQAKS